MGEGCVKSVEDACWVCQCATFAMCEFASLLSRS